MTCCSRSYRFFEYSDTAEGPAFQDFKSKLEGSVHLFDVFNSILSYSTPVGPFLTALNPAIMLGIGSNSSYSTAIHISVLVVDAIYGAVLAISKIGKDVYQKSSDDLIQAGKDMKFFKIAPSNIATNNTDKTPLLPDDDQHIDALRHRLLGAKL